MRIYKLLIISSLFCIFSKCEKDEPILNDVETCFDKNAVDVFDELWLSYHHNYPAFDLSRVDWDSIYSVYRPTIDEHSSEEEIFEVFEKMILSLKDVHSDLIAALYFGPISYSSMAFAGNPKNYIGWSSLRDKYLEDVVRLSSTLSHGKIKGKNIGYLNIKTFSGSESHYLEIDNFIEKFASADKIIIDVRENGGGSEAKAIIIASRFTNESKIYRFTKIKDGCEPGQISDFFELTLEPDGSKKFLGKTIVLTNKKTFSAAEDFLLMMRSLQNTKVVGSPTLGGFATGPVRLTLQNGWSYRISKKSIMI